MKYADSRKHRNQWVISAIGGGVLVAVGGALLIDQLGYGVPYRWVFLVLLVPAAMAITDSFRLASVMGWRSIQPLSRFIAGALFAVIAILMFFKLDTGLILPALIMALGAATIVRALLGRW